MKFPSSPALWRRARALFLLNTLMPIDYKIDAQTRRLNTRILGTTSVDEIRSYMTALTKDPLFGPDLDGIIDLRGTTTMPSADELRVLGSLVQELPRGARTARRAVIAERDALYGLIRMFEVYAEGAPVEYRVFRNEQDAQAWLDAPR